MRRLTSRASWARAMTWLITAVLLGFIAFCLAWRLDGGRWERVESPSMGTVAPVGSLLWVKPVPYAELRPGDFLSFRPPGRAGTIYSHRVLARDADGTLTTKGVISPPDPWRIGALDVVGRVVMTWRGIGWLVQAAPVLLIGFGLVLLVRSLVRGDRRLPVTLVLGAGVVSVALTAYRPLVNAEQLAFRPDGHGGATATYVGTGVLPVRLSAAGGGSVVLHDGEVGSVRAVAPDEDRRLTVELSPVVPPWLWVALVGACFLPAVASSASDLRRRKGRASGQARKVTATTRHRHVHVTPCHSNVGRVRPRRP
ncbi:MAG: hypothetical protein ACTHJH_15850 [Marmoricola sp.]